MLDENWNRRGIQPLYKGRMANEITEEEQLDGQIYCQALTVSIRRVLECRYSLGSGACVTRSWAARAARCPAVLSATHSYCPLSSALAEAITTFDLRLETERGIQALVPLLDDNYYSCLTFTEIVK